MKYDIKGVRHGTIIKVDELPSKFNPGDVLNIHIKDDTIKIIITDMLASCDRCNVFCINSAHCSIKSRRDLSCLCGRPGNRGRFLMPVITEKLLEEI